MCSILDQKDFKTYSLLTGVHIFHSKWGFSALQCKESQSNEYLVGQERDHLPSFIASENFCTASAVKVSVEKELSFMHDLDLFYFSKPLFNTIGSAETKKLIQSLLLCAACLSG